MTFKKVRNCEFSQFVPLHGSKRCRFCSAVGILGLCSRLVVFWPAALHPFDTVTLKSLSDSKSPDILKWAHFEALTMAKQVAACLFSPTPFFKKICKQKLSVGIIKTRNYELHSPICETTEEPRNSQLSLRAWFVLPRD